MPSRKDVLTTQEALNMMREAGVSAQDFIDAVKSGKLNPHWDDGSPLNMEEIEIALTEIENAQKAH